MDSNNPIVKYPSLTLYLQATYPAEYLPASALMSDNISQDRLRTEERRLKKALKQVGIDITMFKGDRERKNAPFVITNEVASLFSYTKDLFVPMYGSCLVKGQFDLIPKPSSTLLRQLLYDACCSINSTSEQLENALKALEEKTHCPTMNSYDEYIGVPVRAAIIELQSEYPDYLTEQEWISFEQDLNYDYRYQWRVTIINIARKKLDSFGQSMGKKPLPEKHRDVLSSHPPIISN